MEPELKKLGYQIIALSPDKPAKAVEQEKSAAEVFSDSDMDAARAFGVSYRVEDGMFAKLKGYGIDILGASGRNHRQLPVPSIFVTSEENKIAFTYVNPNYSMRLDPQVLVAVARSGAGYNPRKTP